MPDPSRTSNGRSGLKPEDDDHPEWVVGITHLVKPPFDPEREAFSGGARFVHFESRDESAMDPRQLAEFWSIRRGAH